jgi:hypothetical protein
MSEAGSIVLLVLLLIAVYVLTRRVNVWRTMRACNTLVKELESRGACDPVTAVALKDAKRNLLRTGLRNFRPEGLKMLMAGEVVGVTHEGKYYLKSRRPSPGHPETSCRG